MSTEFTYTPEWVLVDDCPHPDGFTDVDVRQWCATAVSGWVIGMCIVEDGDWTQAVMFRQYQDNGAGLSPVGPWVEAYRCDPNLAELTMEWIGGYIYEQVFTVLADPNGYCVALFHERGLDGPPYHPNPFHRNHVVTVKPTGSGAAVVDQVTIQTEYEVVSYNNLHQISASASNYVIVSGGEWYDSTFEWEYPVGFFIEGFDVSQGGVISLNGRLIEYQYGTSGYDVRVEGVAAGPGRIELAISGDYEQNPGSWGWAWVACTSTSASILKIEDQAPASDSFYQYWVHPKMSVDTGGAWSNAGHFNATDGPIGQFTGEYLKNTAWEGTPSFMIYTLDGSSVDPDPSGLGWKTEHVYTTWDNVQDYDSTSLPGHPGYPPRTPAEPLLSLEPWWEPGSTEFQAVSMGGRVCSVSPARVRRSDWIGPTYAAVNDGYYYWRNHDRWFLIVVDALGANPKHALVDPDLWAVNGNAVGAGMVGPGNLYALAWDWESHAPQDFDFRGSLWCAKVPFENPNLSATAGPNRRHFQRAIPTK